MKTDFHHEIPDAEAVHTAHSLEPFCLNVVWVPRFGFAPIQPMFELVNENVVNPHRIYQINALKLRNLGTVVNYFGDMRSRRSSASVSNVVCLPC